LGINRRAIFDPPNQADRYLFPFNQEPFGPLALMVPFKDLSEALAEANRLPYGLAAYGYSRSMQTVDHISAAIEAGMVSINNTALALVETPFGGVKDSGYGSRAPTIMYLNRGFWWSC
jgi:succinate-semialdehyde dehydrogenase / glutarate-semialdehyde dehydrogenase